MKCVYCQGEMKVGSADFTDSRNECDVIFHSLPALVCSQCQEPLFEEETVKAIQHVLSTLESISKIRQKIAA